jgi:hypothetical protein
MGGKQKSYLQGAVLSVIVAILGGAEAGALPNLIPYQPPGWSAPIVVSTTTGTVTDSATLRSTDTLYVDWAVINSGNTGATSFSTRLFVDAVARETWVTTSLASNFYASVPDYSLGSLAPGQHSVVIVADIFNAVVESNDTDNRYEKTITVTSSCSASLSSPSSNASITFPQSFSWTSSGNCSTLELGFATSTSPSVVHHTAQTSGVTISPEFWGNVVVAIGTAPTYYWTVGEFSGNTFTARATWRPFSLTPPPCGPRCDAKSNVACLDGQQRSNSAAIGGLEVNEGPSGFGCCTAWVFAAPDVMITNAHCVKTPFNDLNRTPCQIFNASQMRVLFFYECDACQNGSLSPNQRDVAVNRIMWVDDELDFALLEMNEDVADLYGTLRVTCEDPSVGDDCYLIHHALCGMKGFDGGTYTVYDDNPGSGCPLGRTTTVRGVYYDLWSKGGASGAPVFSSATDDVQAINNRGYLTCTDSGFGIPMSLIVPAALPHLDGRTLRAGSDCLICPTGAIVWLDPPSGVVDAARPTAPTDSQTLFGMKTITVTGPHAALPSCFSLCDTAFPVPANTITGVVEGPDGTYTITLSRPITAGSTTTLNYAPTTGPASTGVFISHPANLNADGAANSADVTALVNALNGAAPLPRELLSGDVDRSGAVTAADVLEVVDLLNGAGAYNPWNNTQKPPGSCP